MCAGEQETHCAACTREAQLVLALWLGAQRFSLAQLYPADGDMSCGLEQHCHLLPTDHKAI